MLSRDADQKTTPPRTDSMVQLLLQGLHNKDRKILDSVLDRADEELIENTVKKLPVEFVIPLIRELQHYIKVSTGFVRVVQNLERLTRNEPADVLYFHICLHAFSRAVEWLIRHTQNG